MVMHLTDHGRGRACVWSRVHLSHCRARLVQASAALAQAEPATPIATCSRPRARRTTHAVEAAECYRVAAASEVGPPIPRRRRSGWRRRYAPESSRSCPRAASGLRRASAASSCAWAPRGAGRLVVAAGGHSPWSHGRCRLPRAGAQALLWALIVTTNATPERSIAAPTGGTRPYAVVVLRRGRSPGGRARRTHRARTGRLAVRANGRWRPARRSAAGAGVRGRKAGGRQPARACPRTHDRPRAALARVSDHGAVRADRISCDNAHTRSALRVLCAGPRSRRQPEPC